MSNLNKKRLSPAVFANLLFANFDVAQCALQQVIATKSPPFPHFLSQKNLCIISSLHNSLSNFYLSPHFLSYNLFTPHNLLPPVPTREEN